MNCVLKKILLVFLLSICFFSGPVFSDSIYDRDIIVEDKTRSMKVEEIFKKLLSYYEDEDTGSFLSLVSDERFIQDYITFTDALYSDFRHYDILQVDYWIDKIVADNVKQYVFVKWEKRYEVMDTGKIETLQGYSRFLFDEINGNYKLIELAGNSLFGGSLREWRDEVPPISGSAVYEAVKKTSGKPQNPAKPQPEDPTPPDDINKCEPGNLLNCLTSDDCYNKGFGYWYNNQCNAVPEPPKCSPENLYLCYTEPECTKADGHWYNNTCNTTPGKPDLYIKSALLASETLVVTVGNNGVVESSPCTLNIDPSWGPGQQVQSLMPNETATFKLQYAWTIGAVIKLTGVDSDSNYKNNEMPLPGYY